MVEPIQGATHDATWKIGKYGTLSSSQGRNHGIPARMTNTGMAVMREADT